MKIWGLATYNDFVVACVTLHPGDMAEYHIPSQERATLVFSAHGSNEPNYKSEGFPWVQEPDSQDAAIIKAAIIRTVLEYEGQERFAMSELSKRITYAAVIAAFLLWDEERQNRLLLAESTLNRLKTSTDVDLTPEVDCLRLLLLSNLTPVQANAEVKRATGCRSKAQLSFLAAQRLLDICTFCSQAIIWSNLTEAFCTAGHRFGM